MTITVLKRRVLLATAAAVLATAVLPAAASHARTSASPVVASSGDSGTAQVQHKGKKRRIRVRPDGNIDTHGGTYGAAITRG